MKAAVQTTKIFWQYEDELGIDITDGMFRASIVEYGIRKYPFVYIDCIVYYLEKGA